MKDIYLIASELAIITGHNNFDKEKGIKKVIDSILNRSGIVDKYIPKSNVEEKLLKLSVEELKSVKKELNLGDKSTIVEMENMINKQILSKSLNENITENQSKEKADLVIKNMPILNKCLNVEIKHDLQMKRGNIKEDKNLDNTQRKKNIVITERNEQMYEKVLYIDPNKLFRIVLRGKVDGMNKEYVVETKNRTKRLFNKIPDYEKVQLNAYMFLVEKEKSLHIENYNDTSNEIEYEYDKLFWDDCLEKIMEFTDRNIVCQLRE